MADFMFLDHGSKGDRPKQHIYFEIFQVAAITYTIHMNSKILLVDMPFQGPLLSFYWPALLLHNVSAID